MKKENIARFWFVMIFAVSPLYLSHGYADILGAKTYIVWLSFIVTGLLTVYCFFSGGFRRKPDDLSVTTDRTEGRGLQAGTLLDVFVIFFGAIAVISALLSDWRADSFTGVKAWNVGAYMIAALTAVYFISSRTAKAEKLPLYAITAGGAVTMVIGIFNDLWIDPLGAMAEVDFYWKDTFTSTIGNINTFCGYLSVVIPVGMILFIMEKRPFLKVLWGVYMLLGYMSVILTHADGIYAGIGITTAVAVWYCLKERERLLWLYVCGILFAAAGAAARLFVIIRPEIKMDELSPVILSHRLDLLVGGICFVLLIIHLSLDLMNRKKGSDERASAGLMRILRIIYVILCALAVCAGALYTIRHFGPNFLNRRGLIWQIAFSVLELEEVRETLIGLGPGNIDEISVTHIVEILEYYGDFYTLRHAHNDIMEYFACTGILGAVSYAGIYVGSITAWIKGCVSTDSAAAGNADDKAVRAEKDRQLILTCAFIGAVGYMAQSMLNGPHPLTYAMFMALLALERACVRR